MVSLLLSACCGKEIIEPEPYVTVATKPAQLVGLTTVTLHGSFSAVNTEITEAGFSVGISPDMDYGVIATINGEGGFSATLDDLTIDTQYYFKAYVVANGQRFEGQVLSFRTSSPDLLNGKKWIELPSYSLGAGQVAKAYYTTMKDANYGRNYSILYDKGKRLALWVAFPMNKDVHLGTISRPDPDPWAFDTSGYIPQSAQPNVIRNTYGNYAVDNFDRGHQIASADRNGSLAAMIQTFFVTNITPQHRNLNQGVWTGLETAIRNVANGASVPSQDTLYVVTGPLIPSAPTFVADNSGANVVVPGGYFKVILWSKYNTGGSRSYNSIGFLFEENYASNQTQSTYPNYAKSVSYVEGITGYEFFGNLGLPEPQMATIKSTSKWSDFSNRNNNP